MIYAFLSGFLLAGFTTIIAHYQFGGYWERGRFLGIYVLNRMWTNMEIGISLERKFVLYKYEEIYYDGWHRMVQIGWIAISRED